MKINRKKLKKISKIGLKLAILLFVILAIFYIFYIDHIYPKVLVNSIDVGGKSYSETVSLLHSTLQPQDNLVLTYSSQTFTIPSKDIAVTYDFDSSAKRALQLGRSGNIAFDITQIISSLFGKINYGLNLTVDDQKLDFYLSTIASQIATQPIDPTIDFKNNHILINEGKAGTSIDTKKIKADVYNHLAFTSTAPITIDVTENNPTLSFDTMTALRQKAESLIGKKITINFEGQKFDIPDTDLISFINPQGGTNDDNISKVIDNIAKRFEKPGQDAKFTFNNGRVEEFVPEENGIKIRRDDLKKEILEGKDTINLPVDIAYPKIKTADINNLGIKDLIGKGTSKFAGSIPSRVHNVALAASKLNGVLIPPGVTFSFVQAIGDISLFSGYQQAYIIQNGQTVLGDGGGVCQVSTTLFRAALYSGLPIIERNAHAYRVHYYEEDTLPGVDATIFSPSVDFKFKNDTPSHILIQTKVDTKNLTLEFDLYGTKDGRVANVGKPTVWDVTAAPAPLYTDDPTLPLGVVKQVDFSAPGTKAKFSYEVTRNGEVINKQTFYSNFRPWQAKFLRGTKV